MVTKKQAQPERVHFKLTDGQLGIVVAVVGSIFSFQLNSTIKLAKLEEKMDNHIMYCPPPKQSGKKNPVLLFARLDVLKPEPIRIEEED